MRNRAPPLSVVMPVYNQLPYLDAAVESILRQSFTDFEFVIFDDGSTDGSRERLRTWAARDPRIRLVEGGRRSGPVASSNRAVAESRAPLIARMDADDISHPDRLRRQVALLEEHPGAVLIAALSDTIDGSGHQLRPPDWNRLLRHSPFPPFAHPTIMFRREAYMSIGGYRHAAAIWEDVDLSRRMAVTAPALVIPDPLLSVRLSGANSRLTGDQAIVDDAMDAMYRTIQDVQVGKREGVLPQAFLMRASLHLWQGQRPHVLGRVLRRGALGWDWQSLRMLAWAAWAEISPRSLRQILRWLLAVRNRTARHRLHGAAVVEWQPS
jgi:hypothetical protein